MEKVNEIYKKIKSSYTLLRNCFLFYFCQAIAYVLTACAEGLGLGCQNPQCIWWLCPSKKCLQYDTELMRILCNWLQNDWTVTGQWHLQTNLKEHKFSDIVIKSKNDDLVITTNSYLVLF